MHTENIPDNIEELISTWLADKNRLSTEEVNTLKNWIESSAANRQQFDDRQEIWLATFTPDTMGSFNKDQAYTRFLQRKETIRSHPGKPAKRFSLRPLLYAASVIALLVIVGYTAYHKGNENLTNKFANVVIEAPLGSKTKMYLPDGTLVWLNAGSKIEYSQGFGINERTIQLSGEGYFEVEKNPDLPFSVKTKEMHVNVLGTKFNFKNYLEEEEATVSLMEGKVGINNMLKTNNRTELMPDQKVFLNKKTGEMRVITMESKYATEWTNDRLYFDEELLTDIIKVLERNYNVKITLGDSSLENFRFYGNFIQQENSIENILDILASTGKITYKIEERNIELRSN